MTHSDATVTGEMWNDAYRAQPSAPGFRIAGIRLEQKRGMDPDEIRAAVDLT